MRTQAIIVGTDGTDTSRAAVDWAAREAQRRHLPLRIVHAYEWESGEAYYGVGNEYLEVNRGHAEAVTAAAADRARAVAAELEIDRDTVVGHPTTQLLDAAPDAELIVLGSRGRGGFAGLGLGSVSQRVATHATCPVVVVRGEGVTGGPVAAGVDDSPAADHVLQAAFDAAAGRGCALTVVRAYLPAVPLWLSAEVRAADVETPEQDTAERARLEQQLAPWRGKYPEVPVEVVLTHRSAAAALVELSSRAQLVIVGSHGHGPLAGALLGSVGLQLLHHANCPVHIARRRPAGAR